MIPRCLPDGVLAAIIESDPISILTISIFEILKQPSHKKAFAPRSLRVVLSKIFKRFKTAISTRRARFEIIQLLRNASKCFNTRQYWRPFNPGRRRAPGRH